MTDKEKIIQYLDYKGIKKNRFYKETGFSNAYLESGKSIGVDKLRIIIDIYKDLNPLWFIYDDEKMLKTEATGGFQTEYFKEKMELKDEKIENLKERIKFLEERIKAQDFCRAQNGKDAAG